MAVWAERRSSEAPGRTVDPVLEDVEVEGAQVDGEEIEHVVEDGWNS